ncbi:MAG: Gfo/Idh/MocA family protein [Pseudomonadota bacterium]
MRFGLIGAGAIGRVRKAALDVTPGCQLTAVFDHDSAAAGAIAGAAEIFPSAQALFEADCCDAVVISTPPAFHEALAIAAMEKGKHVLVEKPMANTLDACHRMIEAARRNARTLAVGFNHRYFDAVQVVRDAVRTGAIGRLSYVKGFAGHGGLAEFKAPWMYDKDAMGGGALFDNGIHMIDLVRHILGEVTQVYGVARGDIWKLDRVEDNAFALLQGPDGRVGSLHASWSEWKGYHFYLEAYGDKGMAGAYYAPMKARLVTMDRPGGAPRIKRNFYPLTAVREKLRGWQSTVIRTFQQEFADFVRLAMGEASHGAIATAVDGARAIEIANAVYRASESGTAVPLADTI